MEKIFNRQSEKSKRIKLRNSMPQAEVLLWLKLKGGQVKGYKFRRQYGVGDYVVDFYCPVAKLAVELDGDSHFTNDMAEKNDIQRQRYIESYGIKFLRFTNNEIYQNMDAVLGMLWKALPD